MRNWLAVMCAVMMMSAAPIARQRFVQGVFLGTESGNPIELIAWARSTRAGGLEMENSSLEDAPTLPQEPLHFFLIISNGANVRYYPFFIDRP